MTKAEELFHKIASEIPDTKEGKMFGALCIKALNGKAGVMFWKEFMVFKLPGDEEKKAMALKGAKVFEPADNRPMKGWVQLSFDHAKQWKKLAQTSMQYVATLAK